MCGQNGIPALMKSNAEVIDQAIPEVLDVCD
jgi:hypothetical protein